MEKMERMEIMEMEDRSSRSQSEIWQRGLSNKKVLKTLASALGLIVIVKLLWSVSFQSHLPIAPPSSIYRQSGDFQILPVDGFINTGIPGSPQCEQLRHNGEIQIQQSFHLDDDLQEVIEQLQDHPMVTYEGADKRLNQQQIVSRSWARTAGSSVWLERFNMYLSVSRITLYDQSPVQVPIISFLRGELFDKDWAELENRTLEWQGEKITFPRIFDIPTPYEAEGHFYGPSDPRVVVEDGIKDAEPVIIFNMITNPGNPERTVHLFRPFTKDFTTLTMNGDNMRVSADRAWSPFFYSTEHSILPLQSWPSKYIHFVYSFKPLRILKCHLLNGHCEWVYEHDVPDEFADVRNDTLGELSGGSNLFPIPLKSAAGTTGFVGFPRNHIYAGCSNGPRTTPQMMVLTASSNSHFHVDFMSGPIDFGPAVLSTEAAADPCGKGRNLIASSISGWDRSGRQDIMTLSTNVGDSTVQIFRIHGVLNFLQQLPYLKQSLKYDVKTTGEAMWDLKWATISDDVIACSVEDAQVYSAILASFASGNNATEPPASA